MKKLPGECLILLATLCWSLSGVLTRSLNISPLLSNALRCVISLAVLLPFNGWRVKCNQTILLAALCGGITVTIFFYALEYTSAANAIVIQYTAPIWVLLYNCITTRKPPSKRELLAVALAFGGVAVIFSNQLSGEGLLGNVCALLAGLSFAGLFVVNRMEGASPLDSSILAFALCGLFSFFFVEDIVSMSVEEWGIVLIMGLVQHGLAYVFFSVGISKTPSFSASLIGMLETVLVPLWVFLVFRETPGAVALVGCGMIITAVFLNTLFANRRK